MANEAKEVYFERNIIVSDEDLLLHRKLNIEQKMAYDVILQRVFANKSGAFFIDGHGGSGKTFLYCDLLETFSCNIIKQSSLESLIHDAKLIVWDEVSMVKKNMIESLDSLLKDITDTNVLFGGKVVVFGGDFRQTLPMDRSGKKGDFIWQSILNSKIWNELEKLRLSENMRAKTDPSFCEYLMRIGNGK
ncbi:uncharacterized protein LOC142176009 [Nicotiana tabacum]|uniref:Uncharacterized protein LOC142176009 n=1 Tax=Nicotiana tabacum TaxID=4097 RepID=A0AC58TPI7_TOBAC